MKVFIYALIDPESQEVRYIGKTKNPNRRISQHINECSRIRTHKNNWILSLKNKKLKPIMTIIDEVESDEWVFFEQWYIQLFKSWGCNLTNLTIGGEGGFNCIFSEETIKILGDKRRGTKHTEEAKKKISEAFKGKKLPDEHRKKISIGAKKRGISPETRAKMVASRLKNGTYKKSEETKQIISQKLKIIANGRTIKNNHKRT
jgi:hypothetical protein